jgi:hypothetical protein
MVAIATATAKVDRRTLSSLLRHSHCRAQERTLVAGIVADRRNLGDRYRF